jgi:UDP-N-acetyl-D-galactosamine dehydrogenase
MLFIMYMYQSLVDKKERLALIGLGYVGLPIALAFAKKLKVVGFDISPERVAELKNAYDASCEMEASSFDGCDITFTSDVADLEDAGFYIVCVPTPVDEHNVPYLGHLLKASDLVGQVIRAGNYVVFESTVYPGCTEEDCLPVIERVSGLRAGKEFKLGYSPERINVGDTAHTLQNVVKVVSACDADSLEEIAALYELVARAGVHRTSSIKVAEAAKIIENTQRDLNIALMNELSVIFNKMDINTYEVLEAAATKWNFLPFTPGLVGGHCIGVDPYYLTYKAAELGYKSKLVLAGRAINDGMGSYIAKKVLQHIIRSNGNVKESKVLVMGVTFKENVRDIRNSKTIDVINELKSYSVNVDVVDPYANPADVKQEYGFSLADKAAGKYDAVILTVLHNDYLHFDEPFFSSLLKPSGLLADIKGHYRNTVNNIRYWSL